MKKTIKTLLITILTLCLVFALTACSECEHSYDNACDTACNECGEVREVGAHDFSATAYEDHYHFSVCSACEAPDEQSKEKHALNGDHSCTCGVRFTAKERTGEEGETIIELNNSDYVLVFELVYFQDELFYYVNYYYDNADFLLKEEGYRGDGELDYYFLYEYDENEKLIKESCFYSDGYECTVTYEYDEDGNLSKESYASSDGYECTVTYEYDENGNLSRESYAGSDGVHYVTEYEYDGDGNKIRSTQRFYDSEGNVVHVVNKETVHNFSDNVQSDIFGHWHICQNEGCDATSETEAHKDENADVACDICSFELAYAYDVNTESYIVYRENGLAAVFALGGKILLNNDIELTDYLTVSSDVILDLNGKAITSVDSFSIGTLIFIEGGRLTVTDSQGDGRIETTESVGINVNFGGTLVVDGGSIASKDYALYIDGTVIVNGGIISYIFGAGNYGDISVTVTGGTILHLNASPDDISSITGGTFARNPSEYLSNEYYAVYDETTDMWTVLKHDDIIDTHGEL